MWIAKISGVTDYDSAISVDVAPEFAIGVIIDDINDIRHVSKYDARRIFSSIQNCIRVAEIIPQDLDDIFDIIDTCGPDMIQINGKFFDNEDNLIAVQSTATVPIIGSIFLDKETLESTILDKDPVQAAKKMEPFVSAININLPLGESWKSPTKKKKITKLVEDIKAVVSLPIIIGGGLTATNLAKIINVLKPNGVDVSSGVERLQGLKDPTMMGIFLEEVYANKTSLKGIKIKI